MGKCKKITYCDKIAAMMALASCKNSSKGRRQECRFYYCFLCEGYHLTKQKKKVRQATSLKLKN